jgi:hypothetical protein
MATSVTAQPHRRPMHFIPTDSSWLNQVERFFALITDKAMYSCLTNTRKTLHHSNPTAGLSFVRPHPLCALHACPARQRAPSMRVLRYKDP